MMDKGGSIEIEESEGEYTIDEILPKDEPRNIINYRVLTNSKAKNETRRSHMKKMHNKHSILSYLY